MQDLQLASDTILRLKVNGRTYGKGGYTSPMPRLEKIVIDCLALAIAFFLAVLADFCSDAKESTIRDDSRGGSGHFTRLAV